MKMKRCAKKIVALLAVALMVVSMLGVTAFATEPSTSTVKVTLNCSDDKGGTVDGAGEYESGTEVTVKATPELGYVFVEWDEDGVKVPDAGEEYTFKADESRELTAVFSYVGTVKVTVTCDAESGSVTGTGEYTKYSNVTVAATENPGYHFSGWKDASSGPLSEDATYVIESIQEDKVLTAVFEADTTSFTIKTNANPTEGGSVTVKVAGADSDSGSDSGSYTAGTKLTLTAKNNDGYRLKCWLVGGETYELDSKTVTDSEIPVTVTADAQYTAVFEKVYTVKYVVAGDSKYGTPSDVTVSDTQYAEGTTVKLPTTTEMKTSWTTSTGKTSGVKGTWKFSGWYSDSSYKNAVTSIESLSADTTVYGKWTFTATSSSSSSSSSKTSTTSPKTGETSPILPLMCVAVAACGAAVLVSRKRLAK